jgi:PST family polysaccharide transporter
MAYSLVVILSKVVEAAVYRVIYPLFCEYRESISDMGNIYRRATLAVYAVEAPIYMFLIFNAPVVIPALLGERWRPAVVLIQLLCVYGIINPLPTFGNEILRAKKQDRLLTLSNIIGSVSLMVFGYLLTKSYGAMGMAFAKYIVIGSIPVVFSLYRSIKRDLILLAGQLALVYSIAVIGSGAMHLGFSFSPTAQVAAGILSVPLIWFVYYRMFGREIGLNDLGSLRTVAVEATGVDA